MTQTDMTRQLGIEFERRVQTMIPETEFALKLDTDTIYSFLNQYQDKFVHEVYRNLDNIQSGSNLSARIEAILQKLLTKETKVPVNDVITLSNLGLYVRSTSNVTSTYRYKKSNYNISPAKAIPNTLVSQVELDKYIETPTNDQRILKSPIIAIDYGQNKLRLVHDMYTNISSVDVLYYRMPRHMALEDDKACELPEDVFEDLVSGAVDLYVQYVAGAEARRKQQQQAANAKTNKDNE